MLFRSIIGLPGETVTLHDGRVSVASTTFDEPYIASEHRSHDDFTITLGSTQYFVMGDNRTNSSDSREWGPLDEKFIVGRPIVRLLPLTNISLWPGEYHE